MSSVEDSLHKRFLRDQIHFLYSKRDPIPKEEFFQEFWRILTSFVHHQKANPLIAAAVKEHLDLIPRTYAIISVLYGAFTYQPSRFDLLSAFVGMLDKDLVEEELKATEYAFARKPEGMYFPGLAIILQNVHHLYGSIEYKSEDLPPSPYLGFTFLALNYPPLFDSHANLETIGTALHESHLSMLGVFQKVNARL